MKNILIPIMALLFPFVCGAQSVKTDDNGHVLVGQWQKYEKAVKADLPKDAMAALEAIISEAGAKRLVWDFYEGWNKKVQTGTAINWKDRQKLYSAREKAFEDFDEPVILLLEHGYSFAELKKEKTRLSKRCNAAFYNGKSFLHNDYAFLLWQLFIRTGQDDSGMKEIFAECSGIFGPVMEMYNEQNALVDRFSKLSEGKATVQDYKKLREDCAVFEKKRKALRDDSKAVAGEFTRVESLISHMDAPDLSISAEKGVAKVIFKNLTTAQFTVNSDSKKLHTSKLVNKAASYYLPDTLTVDLPALDDGEYKLCVKNGDTEGTCIYEKYRISAYVTSDADGYRIFAAEYLSGKPLETYELAIFDRKDSRLDKMAVTLKGGGMFKLPKKYDASYLSLTSRDADGRLMSSSRMYVPRNYNSRIEVVSEKYKSVILTDCAAFHRGDRVKFKTIIYKGFYCDDMAVGAAGTKFTAQLISPDGEVVGEKTLVSGKNGSAESYFDIPASIKGGRSSIRVSGENVALQMVGITVDDFVLPDFECIFDKISSPCFMGDTVTVTGCIKAYSGHSIGKGNARFQVSGFDGYEDMEIGPDGRFSIKVPTPKRYAWGSSVTVLAEASTGETLQFSKYIPTVGSIAVQSTLVNAVEASVNVGVPDEQNSSLCRSDKAEFNVEMLNGDAVQMHFNLEYIVTKDGVQVEKGSFVTPANISLNLPGNSGHYIVVFKGETKDDAGNVRKFESRHSVVKLPEDASALDADVENLFIPAQDGSIGFVMGGARGTQHAMVMLYGFGGELLDSKAVTVSGVCGKEGSVVRVDLPFSQTYPVAVIAKVIYFRNGMLYSWNHVFSRLEKDARLDLAWSRFTDMASPASEYTVEFSVPGSCEAAATVFDKSTETIAANWWYPVARRLRTPSLPGSSHVNGREEGRLFYDRVMFKSAAAGVDAMPFQLAETAPRISDMASLSDYVEEEAISPELMRNADAVKARSDFATTLCWAPMLYPDANGKYSFKFRTSDKLGTFIVQVFAHDAQMRSTAVRKEMVVTLKAKVEIAPPQFLRAGDHYVLKAAVSTLDEAVEGDVVLKIEGLGSWAAPVIVPAGSTVSAEFAVDVPDNADALPLKVVFLEKSGAFSDAVAVNIPVKAAVQTLTEAHSEVYLAGADKDAIVARLRSRFVNTSSYGAEYHEVRISQMLEDMLASYNNAREGGTQTSLALSERICAAYMYESLTGRKAADTSEEWDELLKMQNGDGGLAWIAGMESSACVTATVLERLAVSGIAAAGKVPSAEFIAKAVKYLDRRMVSAPDSYHKFIWWRPGISLGQYLYVRSFFPEVAFSEKAPRSLTKDIKEYLLPKNARGLNNAVWAKTLRLSALKNFAGSAQGVALLGAMDVKTTSKALAKSLDADVASLRQYAVEHRSGGKYYPNLVMPWRGLLSSEAYWHSTLCTLMDGYDKSISDGIRIWLMLQKETQHWDTDFAFINAAAAILGGSDQLLETSVIYMSQTYEKPYSDIKAAGNGMRISREFSVTSADGKSTVLQAGDSLRAGDKVRATYRIWNEENRSFVRITIPRHACMQPVKQLSGHMGWWGQGYREVLSDRTVYWFDRYQEEDSTITEEFFVSQEGVFTAPVVEMECLYAPEYRANGAFEGKISAR